MTTFPRTDRSVALTGPKEHQGGIQIWELVKVALQALASNKLRSFLTMLGIIIGVAAVITMISIASGASKATQDSIAKMGVNVLSLFPNQQRSGGISMGLGSSQTLKLEDLDALKKQLPDIVAIAPEYSGRGRVKFENQNTSTSVLGTTTEYMSIRNFKLAQGRYITPDDVRRRAKIAVLGKEVQDTLFGNKNPVGKVLKINGQSFKVVGTMQAKGATGWRSPDDTVWVPLTTAQRRIFAVEYLSGASVQARDEKLMGRLQTQIEDLIKKRHKIQPNENPDVRIFNQADLSEAADATSRVLTLLLTGVALVSLLVGGIGIMNIMLVSVTERTREIGIRKAIGAKARDILSQFLIESITLSLVGGLIGAGMGVSAAILIAKFANWPVVLSAPAIILSFSFAAIVGIFFGIYPASKAARLNPIEALRYE